MGLVRRCIQLFVMSIRLFLLHHLNLLINSNRFSSKGIRTDNIFLHLGLTFRVHDSSCLVKLTLQVSERILEMLV